MFVDIYKYVLSIDLLIRLICTFLYLVTLNTIKSLKGFCYFKKFWQCFCLIDINDTKLRYLNGL